MTESTDNIKLFAAMKAFIVFDGKVLIIRESTKYEDASQVAKYSIPGGRVTPGEKWDDCLRREVREETGKEIEIGRPFFINEWRPIVREEQWHIIAIFIICKADNDQVVLDEDHDDALWIDPHEYGNYALSDTLPAVFEAYLQIC